MHLVFKARTDIRTHKKNSGVYRRSSIAKPLNFLPRNTHLNSVCQRLFLCLSFQKSSYLCKNLASFGTKLAQNLYPAQGKLLAKPHKYWLLLFNVPHCRDRKLPQCIITHYQVSPNISRISLKPLSYIIRYYANINCCTFVVPANFCCTATFSVKSHFQKMCKLRDKSSIASVFFMSVTSAYMSSVVSMLACPITA